MKNPYIDKDEAVKVFLTQISVHLNENHDFTPEDLETLATGFIMAAMPKIVRTERSLCIDFVRSLNHHVADKLEEKRGYL